MKKITIAKITHTTSKWKLADFFRNFIAVVLGIVITFIGSDIITKYNTQKEIREAMQLVKSELLLNRTEVINLRKRAELEQQGAYYLLKHKDRMQETSLDSMEIYGSLPFQWSKYIFIYDAMEMLKTSALTQKIENKGLTLQIIKTYNSIKETNECFQMVSTIKKELQHDISSNKKIQACLISESLSIVELWNSLLKYPEGVNFLKQISQLQDAQYYYSCIELIDKTITAIDREYN